MNTESYNTRIRSGFTLVELSIVLVILGLLTGGILGGQSLIRAAELRSISTEYSRWVAATQTFRDKYFALPGDMSNATKFWGTADATNCATTSTSDARTCDGNGNGVVNSSFTGNPGNEYFRFWQQLANAGLIEGNYSGIRYFLSGDGGESQQLDNSQRSYNVPSSKISQGAWAVTGDFTYNTNASFFPLNYGTNVMVVGGNLGYVYPFSPLLKPEEAWNLDTKMDDGIAAQGKVFGNFSNNCTNAATRTDTANGTYNLTSSALSCVLIFPGVF